MTFLGMDPPEVSRSSKVQGEKPEAETIEGTVAKGMNNEHLKSPPRIGE